MTASKPLVVDLDGSLLRSDSLHESIAAHLRRPGRLWAAASAGRRGRAAFKRALAPGTEEALADAPLNPAVYALIGDAVAVGREVVIATGADDGVARAIASRVNGVREVIASDGQTNLTGAHKADELVSRFGRGGFDYVGNAPVDAAIWDAADVAYLATSRATGVPAWARERSFAAVLRDPRPPSWRVWMRALRVHQSLKNLLLFLPLIASHTLTDPTLLARAIIGFVAFTLMASAVYLLNDTLDIASDRTHPRKRSRPIAAGWISPLHAVAASGALVLCAILVASLLGPGFVTILLAYAAMTTAYSFWLKRITVVDIVTLALLYMVRIVAGAVATGIALSFWFTGVTLFLFLSLALVKRYAEAHQAREEGRDIRGRGYSGDDVHAILALGAATGVSAVLLLAIYIQSDAVSTLYAAPAVLWLVIPLLFAWIAHLWITAGRGDVHDDPLVFALRDPASLVAGALVLIVFFIASLPVTADVLSGILS
ncbi:UbiA family prenyltransferase [Microbacterium hominis]|uniref:UbiA family prenyltransferase n=1 Tax=Microbacterium hominis TaxID=162426 RepID=UPI001962D7E2|nr:UbiA family prenyltransferase [Microbacterium hominis]QRY41712.1 UbiA family prenyltransferase [Microbacterium hominis]